MTQFAVNVTARQERYDGWVARPPLSDRRKAQTRIEIASSALDLFVRDGYDAVPAEAIAAEAGVSLRTFYRYFQAKDEVLSPLVTRGTETLAARFAARPPDETLAEAFAAAFREMRPADGDQRAPRLIPLLTEVPVLRARWLADLRTIESVFSTVVKQRTPTPLSDADAELTGALLVTALRIALERAASDDGTAAAPALLDEILARLGAGGGLSPSRTVPAAPPRPRWRQAARRAGESRTE
jgi:AcrR family transcriptional regulator